MSSWIKVGGGIKRRKGKGADRQRVPERLSGDGNASLTGAYGKGEYLYFLTNYFFRKQNKISLAPQQVQQLDKAPHFKQRQQTHNVCGQGALPTSKREEKMRVETQGLGGPHDTKLRIHRQVPAAVSSRKRWKSRGLAIPANRD